LKLFKLVIHLNKLMESESQITVVQSNYTSTEYESSIISENNDLNILIPSESYEQISDEEINNKNLVTELINYEVDEGTIKRCEHYNRGCYIKGECCKEFFPCRICHDYQKYDLEKDFKKSHKIDRTKIKLMKCRYCGCEQNISLICIECDKLMGVYFCEKCNLIDLDDKGQYHCDKCGLCRVDKSINSHCNDCGLCKAIHKCDNTKIKLDHDTECSICMDLLFSSTIPSSQMKCGHWIHQKCMTEFLMNNNVTCPLCSKLFIDHDVYNAQMKEMIESLPMPDDYKDKESIILCNECGEKSTVKWHFAGHKCESCESYNTKAT
jgi:RING finger/CHY zinc finger protein 1